MTVSTLNTDRSMTFSNVFASRPEEEEEEEVLNTVGCFSHHTLRVSEQPSTIEIKWLNLSYISCVFGSGVNYQGVQR